MKNIYPRNMPLFAASAVLVGTILLAAFTAGETHAQGPTLIEDDFEEIDLSGWVKEHSLLGITKFTAGEFFMRAKRRDHYYYVLVAPEEYSSVGHNTRVTLRNVSGGRTNLGYGLIYHSDPEPLRQDYVFAIDTVTKRYRVARHKSNNELRVIKWTRSPFIRSGRRQNVIEVKDKGGYVDLYINDRWVRSVKTRYAFKNGQPGLYTDATTIAFKNFTLTKVNPDMRQVALQD